MGLCVGLEMKSQGCSDIGHFNNTPVGLVCNNNAKAMQVSKHVIYSITKTVIMCDLRKRR